MHALESPKICFRLQLLFHCAAPSGPSTSLSFECNAATFSPQT